MTRNRKITIRVTEEEFEKIENIAKKMNIPTSRLIRNITLTSIEDIELLNKLGLLDIAKAIKELKNKLSKNNGINLQTSTI